MTRIGQIITDFISVIAGLTLFLNPVIGGLTRNPLKAPVIPCLTRDPLKDAEHLIRGLRIKPAMTTLIRSIRVISVPFKTLFSPYFFNKTTSVATNNYIHQSNLITLLPHYYDKMDNEVNEVGEYLLHHFLRRLFCWNKLGENEALADYQWIVGQARNDRNRNELEIKNYKQ